MLCNRICVFPKKKKKLYFCFSLFCFNSFQVQVYPLRFMLKWAHTINVSKSQYYGIWMDTCIFFVFVFFFSSIYELQLCICFTLFTIFNNLEVGWFKIPIFSSQNTRFLFKCIRITTFFLFSFLLIGYWHMVNHKL